MNTAQIDQASSSVSSPPIAPLLVIEVSLKATGADIHDVSDMLPAYQGAHEMLLRAKSDEDIDIARSCFVAAERALRRYLVGVPAGKAVAESTL